MASVRITYFCGCGFRTEALEAAIRHSEEKMHTLDVHGIITSPKKKPEQVLVAPRSLGKPAKIIPEDYKDRLAKLRKSVGRE